MTRFRPAATSDLDALVRVFVDAFRSGYAGILPADVLADLTSPASLAWLESILLDDSRGLETVLATDVAGAPTGFTRFGPPPADTPGHGYVASLYVAPSSAGRGVGRALLGHALTTLAAASRTDVTLWVFETNGRARHLYESESFRPDGTTRTDPRWRVPEIRLRRAGSTTRGGASHSAG